MLLHHLTVLMNLKHSAEWLLEKLAHGGEQIHVYRMLTSCKENNDIIKHFSAAMAIIRLTLLHIRK